MTDVAGGREGEGALRGREHEKSEENNDDRGVVLF
jgi:hypothetical protein